MRGFQNRVSLLVGEAVRASNHARGEACAFGNPVFVEMNENRMRKPYDSLIKTAHTVAQALRQHWNHAVGQVNAVSTPPRFAIERAGRFYVSSNIGNVHAEMPTAVLQFLNVNRVIEIARVIG